MAKRSLALLLAAAALAVLACTLPAAAVTPSEGLTLVELNKVINGDVPALIKFYAPWCGHCKALAPVWNELGRLYADNPRVVVAQLDCTVTGTACTSQGIRGYPTIKFFPGRGAEGLAYKGGRSVDALMTYLNDKISEVSLQAEAAGSATSARKINIKDIPRKNGLIEADANTLPVLLASPDWVFVNYVTPWCAQCVEMASGWKELARTVGPEHNVYIVSVNCAADVQLCESKGITNYPTTLLYRNGQSVAELPPLDRNVPGFVAFLSEHSALAMPQEAATAATLSPEDPSKGAKFSPEGVLMLTDSSFQAVIQSNVAFIKAFAPWCGHCKKLAPTWGLLAQRFKDMQGVVIAELDCTVYPKICENVGVGGYPSLLLYKKGSKAGEYRGARDKDALVNYVKEQLRAVRSEL